MFGNLDKYMLPHGQIHFGKWANTFWDAIMVAEQTNFLQPIQESFHAASISDCNSLIALKFLLTPLWHRLWHRNTVSNYRNTFEECSEDFDKPTMASAQCTVSKYRNTVEGNVFAVQFNKNTVSKYRNTVEEMCLLYIH